MRVDAEIHLCPVTDHRRGAPAIQARFIVDLDKSGNDHLGIVILRMTGLSIDDSQSTPGLRLLGSRDPPNSQ